MAKTDETSRDASERGYDLRQRYREVQDFLIADCGHDRGTIERWFGNLTISRFHDGISADSKATIGVPVSFYETWIKDNYLPDLERAFEHVFRKPCRIDFEEVHGLNVQQEVAPTIESVVEEKPRIEHSATGIVRGHLLDRRCTFERFVIGNNRYAYGMAKKAAGESIKQPNGPGKIWVLYGPHGTGKTHLMQAIIHESLKHPGVRCYSDAEAYVAKYTEACASMNRGQAFERFRAYFANVAGLFIDEIGLFEGKEKFQKALLTTIEALNKSGKHVVLTSNKAPGELDLVGGLASRIKGAESAETYIPDEETRGAILLNEFPELGARISTLEFLVRKVIPDARVLINAGVRVMNYESLTADRLDSPGKLAANLNDLLVKDNGAGKLDYIVGLVAQEFDVSAGILRQPGRGKKEVSDARLAAMALVREHTNMSSPDVARYFGKKEHSTVLSAESRVERILKEEPDSAFAKRMAQVRSKIAKQ